MTAGGASFTGGPVEVNGDTDLDGNLDVSGTSVLNGAVTATGGTAAAPTLITTDTWHTLGALGAGSGYTVPCRRCRSTTTGSRWST